MLITLRAILLVLFIAAPFGEQRTAADPNPAGFAIDAVLACPLHESGQQTVDTWSAGKRATAHPDTAGDA